MNRPKALVCYICGREFGTKSLAIHIKSCIKKWENEQALKPPKERRPVPQPPKNLDAMINNKGEISKNDMEEINKGSYDTYVDEALIQCEYCGRRFNPKSLVPHQKACKISPMIKKPYVSKNEAAKKEEQAPSSSPVPKGKGYQLPEDSGMDSQQQQNLIPCNRCGRSFAADRVGKHEKICKGEPKKVEKVEVKAPLKPNMKANQKQQPPPSEKQAKWKAQHEDLQNAMKQMRIMKAHEAKGGKLSDLPPPAKGNYDHYKECQYCGRKFAADVAERHIPKCANIINKPGGIKASKIQEKYIGGTGAGSKVSQNSPLKPNMVKQKPGIGAKKW